MTRPAATSLLLLVMGCAAQPPERRPTVGGGDAARGKLVMAWYGCGSCHIIPSIPNASGRIGPSLQDVARRPYLAGAIKNTPDNMVRWILNPQAVHTSTVMPGGYVAGEDARHMASFLYSLEPSKSFFDKFKTGAQP